MDNPFTNFMKSLREKKEAENAKFTPLKAGDRATFRKPGLVTYLVDYDTKKVITVNPDYPIEFLSSYLCSGEAIVGETLNPPIDFHCNHCSQEHKADTVLFFPTINKKFIALHSDLCAPAEAEYSFGVGDQQ